VANPSSAEPSDDERLASIAADFAAAIEQAIPGWIERIVEARVVAAGMAVTDEVRAQVRDTAAATADLLGPRVRAVVTADVDDGGGSPLAALRDGVGPATELLGALRVPPSRRDDFARRAFPDDVYELGPAAFADVDESLVEPGVAWGAARAHVHLRRRGEAGT
jgi:hypothetical protein